ncbi:Reticulon - like 10, partial [Theobroma cacao]
VNMLDWADEVNSDFLNKEEENQSSSSDSDMTNTPPYLSPPRSAWLVVRSLFMWSLVVDNVTISSQLPIRLPTVLFSRQHYTMAKPEDLSGHICRYNEFPKVTLPEDLFVKIALLLRSEFNRASATFPDVASGNDLKKFLAVIVVLWALSVVGSWFSFLTLFYLGGFLSSLFYVFVMLLTVPMLYEKHEDAGDAYAGKSLAEIKSQYAVIDEKVLQKLPASLFHHKQH